VEFLRGAREMAVAGDRLDGSQLPKLHSNDRRTRLLPCKPSIASLNSSGHPRSMTAGDTRTEPLRTLTDA
jgi:hypothetical protein